MKKFQWQESVGRGQAHDEPGQGFMNRRVAVVTGDIR